MPFALFIHIGSPANNHWYHYSTKEWDLSQSERSYKLKITTLKRNKKSWTRFVLEAEFVVSFVQKINYAFVW
jgi:hypothetical protein